jgi:hypothetical protein
VYQRVEGAPPVFLNWYDTVLRVDCTFIDVGLPDRLVCFPSDPVGADVRSLFAWETTYLFTDGACTQPVVNAALGGCDTRFFAAGPQPGDACGTLPHLYDVGPIIPLDPAGLYNITNDGPCHPATASELSSYQELHTLGAEIPLDALVGGTYAHDARAGRIVPLRIVGSDGSIQGEEPGYLSDWGGGQLAAWDNERGERVTTSLRPGGRWLPAVQYQAGEFSDAACTVAAAIGPACHVGAKECFVWEPDECGYLAPKTLYELGAPLADQTSVYYPDSGGTTCLHDPGGYGSPISDPTLGAFAVGAPVPITAFAETKEVHTGSGQVQIVQAGSATDSPVASVGFFDTVHGQPCTVQRNLQAADGVVRCLPPSAELPAPSMDGWYADADCSIPLYQAPAPATPGMPICTPQPTFVSVTEGLPTTGACYMPIYRRHLFPIGDAYAGEVFLGFGSGQCFDVGTADVVGPLRTLGPEVAASEFAAIDYVRPN